MKRREILKHYKHSFQFRVFLALALVIFIFIPGTGYMGYLQARKVAENQMQQYAIGTAVQISKRVSSFLSQHTDNVKLIKSFLENRLIDSTNEGELLRCFLLFKKDHPEFVNIYYGNENGRFLMAPPQAPEIHKIFDPRIRPWYRGAVDADNFHWTDVYLFASTQKPGITVSIPIVEEQRLLRGVCGIDIDLSAFSRFLQGIKIGSQGVAYIFDNKTGHVIAHPGLVQLPWNPVHIDLLRTCRSHLKKSNRSFGLTAFQGENFFTAYTNYPGKEWTVGVTLSVSDYLKNIQFIKQTTFSLVVIGILLSSLLSYLLAMTIIQPLQALQQGIERISSGDLEHKVIIHDPDIAEELAGSFNQMASSLQESLAELKQTYTELTEKEKLAAVGKMTAGIAHEIKNPLGVILGSAQVVVNRERPWEMRERAARFIIDEVIRLNNTLKSFLAFAKPAPPVLSKTDMLRLLEETLSVMKERFFEAGYRFQMDFPTRVPPVNGDSDQLRQVIWNICLNSIKAMPRGGTITVRAEAKKKPGILDADTHEKDTTRISLENPFAAPRSWLVVTIEDQGCGIDKKQMDKIMDPFVSFQDDGIGLGLSIVAQIVKLHQGHINITSQKNAGTAFQLLFPCLPQETPHVG